MILTTTTLTGLNPRAKMWGKRRACSGAKKLWTCRSLMGGSSQLTGFENLKSQVDYITVFIGGLTSTRHWAVSIAELDANMKCVWGYMGQSLNMFIQLYSRPMAWGCSRMLVEFSRSCGNSKHFAEISHQPTTAGHRYIYIYIYILCHVEYPDIQRLPCLI